VRTVMQKVAQYLRPVQVGVGVRGGVEGLVHSFNRVVQALQHDPSLVLAKLDFQNAFNMVCRDNIFRQVREICPEIGHYVSACYGGEGYLFVGEHLITASRGVHQGDPLGLLLFALAIHPFLVSIRERFPGILQGWYLDDGNLIGDTDVIRRVIHAVVEEGPSWGYGGLPSLT
jgi:Reverse transcriptase (RNA-dependent DNA polymerase)